MSSFETSAQITFQKTFGGGADNASSAQQTDDGGYIIAGSTFSFGAGGADFYLIKTDTLGNLLWSKTYGGTEFEEANSVVQTNDGGYIIVGFSLSFGGGGYIIKTNLIGDTTWTKIYLGGGSEFKSVHQTFDGGYIMGGVIGGDAYLVKTDSLGGTQWTKIYGGTNVEKAFEHIAKVVVDKMPAEQMSYDTVDLSTTTSDEKGCGC